MGDKHSAREAAVRAGVPVVPGTAQFFGVNASDEVVITAAEQIGYPLLVKAVAGGGGKGMRAVVEAGRSAVGAANGAVGGGSRVRGWRNLPRAPSRYTAPHRGSAARRRTRHRRAVRRAGVFNPAAAPEGRRRVAVTVVGEHLRRELAEAAAAIARTVGYTNAGTIEFLLDSSGRFYFLEMNTRLQVEHPITEAVTGVDLVRVADSRGSGRTVDGAGRAGADAARSRHRVPNLCGGSRPWIHAGARSRAGFNGSRRAIRAGRPRRHRRVRDPRLLRLLDCEVGRLGRDPRVGRSRDSGARSMSTASSGSAPRCRSSVGWSNSRRSPRAPSAPRTSTACWPRARDGHSANPPLRTSRTRSWPRRLRRGPPVIARPPHRRPRIAEHGGARRGWTACDDL